jgi:hypothetical protein
MTAYEMKLGSLMLTFAAACATHSTLGGVNWEECILDNIDVDMRVLAGYRCSKSRYPWFYRWAGSPKRAPLNCRRHHICGCIVPARTNQLLGLFCSGRAVTLVDELVSSHCRGMAKT